MNKPQRKRKGEHVKIKLSFGPQHMQKRLLLPCLDFGTSFKPAQLWEHADGVKK